MAVSAYPATLEQAITEEKTNELSYRVLHRSAVIRNEETGEAIETPFLSYTSKYRNVLSAIIQYHFLDEEESAMYRFRPKLFSYNFYGTTDFWYDILVLNNCASIKDFEPAPDTYVAYYSPQLIKDYINEILILEGVYV